MAVIEQYYDTISGYYNQIREAYWHSQSFTPDDSKNIVSVELWIDKTSSSGLTEVTVELYAADVNHKPTGSLLATGSVLKDDIQLSVYGDEDHPTTITFDSPYGVTSSTEYCLVIKANAGSYYTYLFSSNTGYSGYHFHTTNSGGYWATDSDDLVFITYDDQPPAAPASITYPETNSHGENIAVKVSACSGGV